MVSCKLAAILYAMTFTHALAFGAGAVVIPSGHSFPGTAVDTESSPAKKPIFFATAGESGVIKIWSSVTARCVYEHKGNSSTSAGNHTYLALLPGSKGLMAATADCNLQFLEPKVGLLKCLPWP